MSKKVNTWTLAVKRWNVEKDDDNWCMPKKGSDGYKRVEKIRRAYNRDPSKIRKDYKVLYGKSLPKPDKQEVIEEVVEKVIEEDIIPEVVDTFTGTVMSPKTVKKSNYVTSKQLAQFLMEKEGNQGELDTYLEKVKAMKRAERSKLREEFKNSK